MGAAPVVCATVGIHAIGIHAARIHKGIPVHEAIGNVHVGEVGGAVFWGRVGLFIGQAASCLRRWGTAAEGDVGRRAEQAADPQRGEYGPHTCTIAAGRGAWVTLETKTPLARRSRPYLIRCPYLIGVPLPGSTV